jgi:hypothetical protein
MRRVMKTILAMAGAPAILIVSDSAARPDDRTELLKVREGLARLVFVTPQRGSSPSFRV